MSPKFYPQPLGKLFDHLLVLQGLGPKETTRKIAGIYLQLMYNQKVHKIAQMVKLPNISLSYLT